MASTDFFNLTRPIQPMPDFVEQALLEHGLMTAYRQRPAYQQNDYLIDKSFEDHTTIVRASGGSPLRWLKTIPLHDRLYDVYLASLSVGLRGPGVKQPNRNGLTKCWLS